MDDDILIELKLDDREIVKQMDTLSRKLQKSLDTALGGKTSGGGATRAMKDQEAAAIRLAQAQARLAVAGGNLTKAQTILDTALARTTKETVTQINAQTQLVRVHQQAERATRQNASAVSSLGGAFRALAGLGVVSFFENFARRAIDAAVAIDKQVNTLKALTGSAEAAQKRFQELFAIAQKTPGLTTNLAATLDAQLRVFNVNVQTIDKLLPVIGRLNAISPLSDPKQFVNNLTQLISQNFERQDLKELVGQSPIAGQLIKEIFNVDNPTNAEAIRAAAKRLGVTSVERLAEEFIKAGQNNQALKNATESIAGQFEKMQDRINVALKPIGEELLKSILPASERIVGLIESSGPRIADILRNQRDEITKISSAMFAVLEFTGRFISLLDTLDQKTGILSKINDLINPFQQLINGINSVEKFLNRNNRTTDPRLFTGPEDAEAGGITGAGLQSQQFRSLADFLANRPIGSRPSPSGGGLSGARSREKTELQKVQEETKRVRERVAGLESETSALVKQKLELLQLKLREDELDKALNDKAFRAFLTSQGKPLPPQPPNVGITDAQRRAIRLAPALGSPGSVTGTPTIAFQSDIEADRVSAAQAGRELSDQRLRVQEAQIQNQLNRGLLTQAEAQRALSAAQRASRDEQIALLEVERQAIGVNSIRGLQITEEIERLRFLGVELSSTERFMRGFNSSVEDVGDAFERFGQNVARAFTNVRDLFNGLKQAVLGFFNDLLGSALQNLVRSTLGGLFGGAAGGGGGIGNIFRTPSTFPSSLAFAGDGGITTPPSISATQGIFGSIFGGGGVSGPATRPRRVTGAAGIFSGFSLSNLTRSIGAAAPFLGLSLGAGAGGQSRLGSVFGAVGGGIAGLAVTGALAPGLLAAPLLAALPIAAPFALPLIVGAVLLGKAAQRRKDEEASGQFLTQALQGIEQMAQAAAAGQFRNIGEARSLFESQIIGTFQQQINTLKTKSVRESRLTNQVRDLRNVFEARIPPLISQAEAKAATSAENAARFARQIPQFATGGTTRGGVALLHPGEKVLNLAQQRSVIAQSNPEVFERAGVPGPSRNRVFDIGGTMGSGELQPIEISIEARVMIGKDDATRIVVVGASTPQGRAVTVKNINTARTDKDI